MSWCEIKVRVSEDLKESVINRLFEVGAESVNECDSNSTDSLKEILSYFPEEKSTGVCSELKSYLKSIAELFPHAPPAQVSTSVLPNENWGESYKKHYKAQKLSHLFYLV